MLGKTYTNWTVPEPSHFPLTVTPDHSFTCKDRDHMGALWTADSPWQRSQGLHKTPHWIWGFKKLQICPVCRIHSRFSSWSPELPLEETTTPYVGSWLMARAMLGLDHLFLLHLSLHHFSVLLSSLLWRLRALPLSLFWIIVCLFLYWFLSLIMSYRSSF